MSTILKALRRLERDRKQAEGQRPLREEIAEIRPGVPLERSSSRSLWWVAASGVGLIVVLVLALGWPRLVRKTEEPPALARVTPPGAQPPAARARAPQRPASQAMPTDGGRSAPRAASGSPTPVPAQPRPMGRSAPPLAPPPAPQASNPAPPESPAPGMEARSEPSASAPASSPAEPRAPREARVDRVIPEAPTAPSPVLDPTPAPPRPAAPQNASPTPRNTEPSPAPSNPEFQVPPPTRTTRAERAAPPPPTPAPPKPSPKIEAPAPPEVLVERTVWHPDASRRRAFLRIPGLDLPASLREGDSAGTLVVLRIEPSGVVFLHEGRELRRAVGQGG